MKEEEGAGRGSGICIFQGLSFAKRNFYSQLRDESRITKIVAEDRIFMLVRKRYLARFVPRICRKISRCCSIMKEEGRGPERNLLYLQEDNTLPSLWRECRVWKNKKVQVEIETAFMSCRNVRLSMSPARMRRARLLESMDGYENPNQLKLPMLYRKWTCDIRPSLSNCASSSWSQTRMEGQRAPPLKIEFLYARPKWI